MQVGPDGTSMPALATAAAEAIRTRTHRTWGGCSASSSASIPSPAAATASRPATRSVVARVRWVRSMPTACATPTASRSTARRGAHGRRRRPGRRRGDRLPARPLARTPAGRGHQLRLGRLRGPQPLRGRQCTGARAAGDSSQPGRRLLLDHRRLRDPRPLAARVALVRPLRVRRTATRRCASPRCGAPAPPRRRAG